MTNVVAVAAAIRCVEHSVGYLTKDDYLRMAQAAIEAMGLTEQWGVVIEDEYEPLEIPEDVLDTRAEAEASSVEKCLSCDHCRNAYPKHLVSRLVSPWVRTE